MQHEIKPPKPAFSGAEHAELEQRMRSYAAITFALSLELDVQDIAELVWPSLQDEVCGIAMLVIGDDTVGPQMRSQAGFGEELSAGTVIDGFGTWGVDSQRIAVSIEHVHRFANGEAPGWLGDACASVFMTALAGPGNSAGRTVLLFAMRAPSVGRPMATLLLLTAQRMGDSLARASQPTEPVRQDAFSTEGVIKVLLIDDEPHVVARVRRILVSSGFEFHVCDSGEHGLNLATSLWPDVIVVDTTLPDMDGMEVLRMIRRSDRLSMVPVIMLSARGDEPSRIRALRSGADDFIAKPFTNNELRVRIHANVHMARARRAAVLRESEVLRLRQSQQELRKLLDTVQNVRADERRYLAREVHDQLGQLLTVAKIDIRLLDDRASGPAALPGAASMLPELRSAMTSINMAIASVQNISLLLRPPVMENGGLVAALRWQASDFQRRAKLLCTVVHDEHGFIEPSQFVSEELFRMCQEALTNAVRHASATCVQIGVSVRGQYLLVRVADNGGGMSRDLATRSGAVGIAGMRERAASIRARLEIHGRPGRGTILTIRRRMNLPD